MEKEFFMITFKSIWQIEEAKFYSVKGCSR